MEAFYVCMIFLGSILVLVSLFFSIMDKVNGKDFFTEFDRKKDEMFTLIADAEEMIQELNKMSDYVIGTISDKSQELIQLENRAGRIKGNTYDVPITDKSNVVNANKSDVINANKSNVVNANKSNVTDDSNVEDKSNNTDKSNATETEKSNIAKADKYIVNEAKKSNVKEVHAVKPTKVDASNKVNSQKKASQNSSNNNTRIDNAKEDNVKVIDTDNKEDSIEAVEDTIEISKQGLSKLQSASISLHDGNQAQQINTYQQSPGKLNEYQHKVLFSEQKYEDNATVQNNVSSYNKTSSMSPDNFSNLSVNEKRREALILIQRGLSNTEISGLLKIGKGEVALLRGLNK